jgi:DNA-binding winged helix-turn-helix (wHTH) protein
MVSPYLKPFSAFALDESKQCLWRMRAGCDPERILLKPKAYDILRHLVNNAGRLVTHDELLNVVWPDTHVQQEVLKRHVFDVRNALGDDPKTPTYIETFPRRGYQFIAPVCDAVSAPSGEACTAQANLVGRERALGELRTHIERAFGGRRQLLFVTGEPGMGKTALVDEFQRQVAAAMPVRIARGQCVEGFSGEEAYYPILEAVGNDERVIAAWLAGESAGTALNDLAALLYRHSEGNPLFMAALEHFCTRGVASRRNGQWQLRVPLEEIGMEVPENLRQLIELHVDRLSEEERRALETASVSGVQFSTTVCAQAAAMDIEEFEAICARLSRRNYLIPSKDQEGFRFAHSLYREALFRRLSPGRGAKPQVRELVRLFEDSGARRSAA